MNMPAVRAMAESGAVYDSPSDDVLRELLARFEGFEEDFLIVERAEDPNGETYIQVGHVETPPWNYVVEYRDGDSEHHFQAFTNQVGVLHETITGWMFQRAGWRDLLDWRRV